MRLIVKPRGYTAHIIQPHPNIGVPPEFDRPFEPDSAIWKVKQAVDRHKEPTLKQVRQEVKRWLRLQGTRKRHLETLVDVYIQSALDHPWTPFAIRYTYTYRDDVPVQPLVIWRGRYYNSGPDGSLTPTGERDPYAPKAKQWYRNQQAVRDRLAGWS